MRVRCIKLDKPHADQSDGWLTIGREYDVLELYCDVSRGVMLRIIGDEPLTPALFKGELFEMVNDAIPGTWVAGRDKLGGYKFGPKVWHEPGFWERFFDQEPKAVKTFTEEYRLMKEIVQAN